MKIIKTILLVIAVVASSNAFGEGQSFKMIFWYPGEAGSTVEAQAFIDTFFEYLNKEIAPYKVNGKYFNSTNEGLAYIRNEKPSLGIVSFAAYAINKDRLGKSEILLQTLPLPDGMVTEKMIIVGKGTKPADFNGTLFSKQPLTDQFVTEKILSGDAVPKITVVQNILPTLKEVVSSEKKGGVLLQPMEYYTLKKMNQPWAKELSVWHTSPPIPSAPLVVFGELSADLMDRIKNTLLQMSKNPTGITILNELRLTGFATAGH